MSGLFLLTSELLPEDAPPLLLLEALLLLLLLLLPGRLELLTELLALEVGVADGATWKPVLLPTLLLAPLPPPVLLTAVLKPGLAAPWSGPVRAAGLLLFSPADE